MLRLSCLLLLLLFGSASRAESVPWQDSCAPFSDACLFELASKEMHGIDGADVRTPLFTMAFHAGRLGYSSIPGDSLDSAPRGLREGAVRYLLLGKDVAEGRISISLDQPVTDLRGVLLSPYLLPRALIDLSQTDVQSVLLASSLSAALQGEVLGRLFVMELNEGEYRFMNGQIDAHLNYLDSTDQPFLAISSLAIILAEEGYTREARDIVNRYLVPDDYHRFQDVLLYIEAIQAVFEGDILRVVSLVSAMQGQIFRLEALGHLYGYTRDQFVGEQFFAGLYEPDSPLAPLDRRNLLLFTLSTM